MPVRSERSSIWVQYLVLMVRLALGGIFVYAGIPKILNPAAFAEAVYNYQILPDVLINLVAIVLPWTEVVVGGLLVAGLWMPGAVLVCTLMLASFITALVFNLARGLNIHCGCFSVDAGDPINNWTIARDISFFLMALFLSWAEFSKKDRALGPPGS